MKIIATSIIAAALFGGFAITTSALSPSEGAVACDKCEKHNKKEDEEKKDGEVLLACDKCEKHNKKEDEEKKDGEVLFA